MYNVLGDQSDITDSAWATYDLPIVNARRRAQSPFHLCSVHTHSCLRAAMALLFLFCLLASRKTGIITLPFQQELDLSTNILWCLKQALMGARNSQAKKQKEWCWGHTGKPFAHVTYIHANRRYGAVEDYSGHYDTLQ